MEPKSTRLGGSSFTSKKIIKIILLTVSLNLLIMNGIPYIQYQTERLRNILFSYFHTTTPTDSENSLPIFAESIMDFDDFNTVDVKRLSGFIIICLLFVVPFFF
ncbi:uncharacterized protein NDAI_0F03090 [Naumovozyma dairenensis CBS 421]|uniref:Uncharacterized protein n=1 Tax=Naumovozyma dairenensis (strain ATCC 10597 / BCRC 20456 / CBS 421 / NBRC 0211 / NRRL Y-12639) TaxID=1071378 RepID=G0WCW6_NAUDC|nr:hypothetical protein NDAI_0F03090 [Naumovozyma dairenensis CBS 421]CCD25627.1 hypothetical protein NDAI_0F03090 [Naumovozyma dairenensis CBS 421]